MANDNTIASIPLLPGAAQGASSTAEFQFNNSLAAAASVTVGPYLNKRWVKIRMGGRVTGGTTTNFTAKIYQGTAINSVIFTSGAVAVNSVSGNFFLEADLLVDSTSGKLQGLAKGQVNATAVATAATTAISSLDPTGALSFSASGTFSASNASNAAQLDFFEVDAL